MQSKPGTLSFLLLTGLLSAGFTFAQEPNAGPSGTEFGFFTFQTKCMTCHGNPAVDRAPSPAAIRAMTPERIYEALTTGVMKSQGAQLSDPQKRTLALFMSGRPLGSAQQGDAASMPNKCSSNPPMTGPSTSGSWNGWGVDSTNARFQTEKAAGFTAAQVPNLKLKWAFAFPTGVSSFGQPTVVSGRVFVGSDIGYVYSLDSKTGCVYWSFQTQGSVRNAISVGPVKNGTAKYAVYFGDAHANVYAVDAQTGKQLWMKKVDDHFTARITGAPALYQGRVYAPVSSSEEFSASTPDYPCCTFRGSVVALNANTGDQIWKAYSVDEPKPTRKNSKGLQLYAPAGVAIWNTPTVDPKRKAIYFGTGDSETEPAAKTSDSIMAVSMDTGKMLWVYQIAENDAFLGGCNGGPNQSENCPAVNGPDLDIGNSPVLKTLANGKTVLVAGTKDGLVIAVDPDKKGALVWKGVAKENPKNTPLSRLDGIVWGGSADAQNIYYGLSGGGMAAMQLLTGERIWLKQFDTGGRRVSNAAAATAIPGVVFVGGTDGILHALATKDGQEIWSYNTAHEYETVNKIPGKGGSIGSAGPTIAGGMLFVNSGYGVIGGTPGNVILAFGVE
jgi:polyvinyl alcohol dehydrogenase (cytochrome)